MTDPPLVPVRCFPLPAVCVVQSRILLSLLCKTDWGILARRRMIVCEPPVLLPLTEGGRPWLFCWIN